MMREALAEDAPAIDAFLSGYAETSMFLRSNLKHGVGWTEVSHSTRYFLWLERTGIRAVFGLTKAGYLLGQAPGVGAAAFEAFAKAIAGETVIGMTGAQDVVEQTLRAVGLDGAPFSLSTTEPLYRLELANLPPHKERIRRANEKDIPLLFEWFRHYEADTDLHRSHELIRARAHAAVQPESNVRLICAPDDTPMAMASLNATVDDIVQVGGVFVPREARNQGLGRRVTHALLSQAHARGAKTAILFASSPAASRAYEAIGFQLIGNYQIALLQAPRTIGALA